MLILIHHPVSKSFPQFVPSLSSKIPIINSTVIQTKVSSKFPLGETPNFSSESCKGLCFSVQLPNRRTRVPFCSKNGVFEDFTGTLLSKKTENGFEELELLNKPSPKLLDDGSIEEIVEIEPEKPDKDEVLETFYKFFKLSDEENDSGKSKIESSSQEKNKKVSVEYYDPKPGDSVVGVVVSGNENKLDVNVGADLLGTMLTKEVLPLYDKEMEHLLCDVEDVKDFMVRGKIWIVKNDEAVSEDPKPGKPVVEPGTVLFAEVLGRTLSGRPLLSTRRLVRRIAWHRVRQIKQLNEPIEVKITEWNTGGLLTRIEGLRAFLPKAELMNKVSNFTQLKENVGRRIYVQITRINSDTNDLILSEKEAWEMLHLQEGTLLEGTVRKIFPYGAQIRIGDTKRSGLLHISNITKGRIASVTDLLAVGEKVKVLVVKSMFPDKISLSTADLESVPGLFLSNKEKVFSEAEAMAKRYRQKILAVSATRKEEALPTDGLPFENEETPYANWKWFKFERDNATNP
ncbi:30S ribosomal S1 homolog A [Olea europaea subsp. europaea]|uniref:30S ribosomal S1 homolog A n=1 Tax=Olea europaea subsp. europaea TaxID=158383 RepID=A0A8S0QK35_OLEEU|nr:30S ribosomal S1 homolog A [Olea europaea subsp. europaea]